MLAPETTVWQYTHGVADPSLVSPDGYTLDNIPEAEIRLLDTGHFALETHAGEIGTAIRGFLIDSGIKR